MNLQKGENFCLQKPPRGKRFAADARRLSEVSTFLPLQFFLLLLLLFIFQLARRAPLKIS